MSWIRTKYACCFETDNLEEFIYMPIWLNFHYFILTDLLPWSFCCLCSLSSDSCQTFLLGIFGGFPWESSTCATYSVIQNEVDILHSNQRLVSQVYNFYNPEDAPNGFVIKKGRQQICISNFSISQNRT